MVLALLAIPLTALAVFRDFGFDGCSWRGHAIDSGYGTYAETRTQDRNGGCRRLDADVKYYKQDYDGPYTKWCPNSGSNVEDYACVQSGGINFHHQSQSRAQSWETDRWQTSGWWG